MRSSLHGGGCLFPFGDVSVPQGAAGQEAWQGGLLHCGTHLELCFAEVLLQGLSAALAQMSPCVVLGESCSCLQPFPVPLLHP